MNEFVSAPAWIVSGLAHAGLALYFAVAPPNSIETKAPAATLFTIATATHPAPPAEPDLLPPSPPSPPSPLLTPEPTVARASKPTPKTDVANAHETEPPKPASDPKPLDLTGTTLTSERGTFATITGNGEAFAGPIGTATRSSRHSPSVATEKTGTGTSAGGVEITAHKELTSLPKPPDLGNALLENYPASARAMGQTGNATVSLIVYQDGRVGNIAVRQTSSDEFARACVRVLERSRWTPPIGKDARPTATRVGYTCSFDVR